MRTVLERLLADPETVREHVRAHYSWDSVTDAYERLFRELLDEAR